MSKDDSKAKIYRFDYMSPDNILHHKYYSCLSTETAISQFEAGCEHKSIEVESFQVYECQPGCYKWELVMSKENEEGKDWSWACGA